LTVADLDRDLVLAFLDDLETKRQNAVQTRNMRLTAIRSFFRFAAYEMPTRSAQIERILATPAKRFTRRLIQFLTRPEVDALLKATDRSTWIGQRDYALLLLTIQTGLRQSEITGLTRQSVMFGVCSHIQVCGKGRKERAVPLCKSGAAVLKAWLDGTRKDAGDVVFPSARGGRALSADAVQHLMRKYLAIARKGCPSLRDKRITFHCLRRTMAMDLLHAGVESSVIALWLGHESVETTQIYLDADLALKEKVLAKTTPIDSKPGKFRPSNQLLSFLDKL